VSYKRLLTVLALFLAGYASIAAASLDPSVIQFDWAALGVGLLWAGLAQPALSTASMPVQIVTTIGALAAGWGGIEVGTGYRYTFLHFDWRALGAALTTAGIVHTNNDQARQLLGIQPHAMDQHDPVKQ
jgi:hypothetical protein